MRFLLCPCVKCHPRCGKGHQVMLGRSLKWVTQSSSASGWVRGAMKLRFCHSIQSGKVNVDNITCFILELRYNSRTCHNVVHFSIEQVKWNSVEFGLEFLFKSFHS